MKSVFEVLEEKITDQVESLKDALCFTDMGSMENMQYVRGQLRGLLVALGHVKDLAKNFEDNNE